MTPANILIVEDELLVAADIERQLAIMGHHISGIATSAASAYQHAASVRPDLVLMDIRIKGPVNGIEAAKHLRETYQIPAVFLTAHADSDTLQQAASAEPFGYVTKPFNSRALAAAVEIALHRHRVETKITQSERWLSLTLLSLGEAVIVTDRASKVSFINPAAEQLTGWVAADAIGKPLEAVFNVRGVDNDRSVVDLLEHAYSARTISQMQAELVLTRRDESSIKIDNSVTPICEPGQKIVGVAIIFKVARVDSNDSSAAEHSSPQDLLIDSVAHTTEQRDRDDLDAAVADLFLQFKEAESACVYNVFDESGCVSVVCKLAQTRGQKALKLNGCEPFPALRLADMPAWQQCVTERSVVQYPTVAEGWRTVFPIESEREVVGLLELETNTPFSAQQIVLVGGVMRILKNHISLLDYGECDTLTGLLNRKTFESRFVKLRNQLQGESSNRADPSWLAIVDIDKFKSINDTYGHLFGDEVLLLVSQLMKRSFRGADFLFRFGGEEFVIVLDQASKAGAAIAFDRLRETIANHRFPQVGRVTISLGYTQIASSDIPSNCVERADAALYYAKHHGRNNTRFHEELVAAGELTVKQSSEAIELF